MQTLKHLNFQEKEGERAWGTKINRPNDNLSTCKGQRNNSCLLKRFYQGLFERSSSVISIILSLQMVSKTLDMSLYLLSILLNLVLVFSLELVCMPMSYRLCFYLFCMHSGFWIGRCLL